MTLPRIRRIYVQRGGGWYWAAFRTPKSRRPFIVSSSLFSLSTRLRRRHEAKRRAYAR